MAEAAILEDKLSLEGIKEKSRPVYAKAWQYFRAFFENAGEFDSRMPREDEFSKYFRHLRTDKGFSSSSMWTTYSMVNSVVKGKYGRSLQEFPRVKNLLKSYDVDIKKKAKIFSKEDIQSFVTNECLSGPYWLVRKAIVIVAYFGGLRHTETMALSLEKFTSKKEGMYVVHERAKQRSDKQQSKFLVPRSNSKEQVDFAGILETYISRVKDDISKYTGRAFWTGRSGVFVNQPIGKNTIAAIPQEMAKSLCKDDFSGYTFHSMRRSACTAAADDGATPQQMVDFFGWKSMSMPQEYISTSNHAMSNMATLLTPQPETIKNESNSTALMTAEQPAANGKESNSTASVSAEQPVANDCNSISIDVNSKMCCKKEKIVYIQTFNGTINM